MKTMPDVYLALGTNLGNRPANLTLARQELAESVTILKESSIYETPPWGVTDQRAFLNQVLKVHTALPPHELLLAVKDMEASMGRIPSIRFGPRLIDIDILLYDDLQLKTPDLILPHPRMFERAFVLVPLLEVAPELISPLTNKPIAEILSVIDRSGIDRWEENHA